MRSYQLRHPWGRDNCDPNKLRLASHCVQRFAHLFVHFAGLHEELFQLTAQFADRRFDFLGSAGVCRFEFLVFTEQLDLNTVCFFLSFLKICGGFDIGV